MRKARVESYPYITVKNFPSDRNTFDSINGMPIQLVEAPTPKGIRRYLLCPACGQRRAKLHLKDDRFACRVCHDLQYTSSQTRGNGYHAIHLRALRIGKMLGVRPQPPAFHAGIEKPRGMHWATYWPLYKQLVQCSADWDEHWLSEVKRSGWFGF